jgi:hypothetical protein
VTGATGLAADQPGDDPDLRRVAVALLRRIEAALRLPRHPESTVELALFGAAADPAAPVLDSLDVIEAMVVVQEDLGVRLLDPVDLAAAVTLLGVAVLARERANRGALDAFCDRWATAGDYRP